VESDKAPLPATRDTDVTSAVTQKADKDDVTAIWHFDVRGAAGFDAISRNSICKDSYEPEWRRDDLDTLLDAVRVLDVSDAAISLFGLPVDRDHLLSWPVVNLWPEQSHGPLANLLLQTCTKVDPEPTRTRIPIVGWLNDVVLSARRAPENSDVVILSVTGTVSAASALLELQSRQDRWRNMLSAMPIPIWQVDARPVWKILDRLTRSGVDDLPAYLQANPGLTDLAGEIILVTQVNDAAVRLLGAAEASELLGPVEYFFKEAPGSHQRVMVAHSQGLPTYVEELQIRTLDGRLQDVLFMVMFPGAGRPLDSTIVLMVDNTERIATETKLRRIEADFARAARIATLGELTASIAHEVKQPISAILTNAETTLRWLAKDPPNLAKAAQLTERIIGSAGHANDIINRIQDTARQRAPHRRCLNLNEVATQAASFVRYDTEEHGISLRLELADDLPKVSGDRVQLQQVLVNLLVNSTQALKGIDDRRRKIQVRTYVASPGSVGIWVHDTGHGIPDADLSKVFDGFFSTKEDGLGIGLAICKSIVSAHGGSIGVHNAPQGGAVFEIFIPSAEDQPRP
jgi:signal transduction histidine kinase